MTTPSSQPAPGWYPDPAGPDSIRYWDGAAWTDRVQPKSMPPPPSPVEPQVTVPVAVPATQPVPAPPAPPAQPVPTPPFAQPTQPVPAPPAPAPAPQPYTYGNPYASTPPPQPPGSPPLVDPYAYAPPPMVQPTGKLGPDNQVLAGFWRRVAGYLLDSLVTGIPAAIAWFITALVIMGNGGTVFDQSALNSLQQQLEAGTTPTNSELFAIFGPGFWTASIVALGVWLIVSLWNGVYLISRSGQTIGDRGINVRKVMAGRTVPGFAVALARWMIPNVLLALIGNLVPFGYRAHLDRLPLGGG